MRKDCLTALKYVLNMLNLSYSCRSRILKFLHVLSQLRLNLWSKIIAWWRLKQSLIGILFIALKGRLLIGVGTFKSWGSLSIKSAYTYIALHKTLVTLLKLVKALLWWKHGWLLHEVIISLWRWLFRLSANLSLFVTRAALRTINLEWSWNCKGIPKLERLRVISS